MWGRCRSPWGPGTGACPPPPTPTPCLPDGQAEGCPHPPNIYPLAASCTEAQCFPPTAWTRGSESRAIPDPVPVEYAFPVTGEHAWEIHVQHVVQAQDDSPVT